MVPGAQPSSHPKRYLGRFSCFAAFTRSCPTDRQTDRQTDRPRYNYSNIPLLMLRIAMRPNDIALLRCAVCSSITYTQLDVRRFCSAKDGTFGVLQMLLNHKVDVIFGPLCSSGRLEPRLIHRLTNIQSVHNEQPTEYCGCTLRILWLYTTKKSRRRDKAQRKLARPCNPIAYLQPFVFCVFTLRTK